MKKERFDYITTVIGVVLLAAGLFLVKTLDNPRGFMLALPYVCIGIGCGVFGHGIGNVISSKATRNSPDIQKKLDIEQKDERNIIIANRAKAKAYDDICFWRINDNIRFNGSRYDSRTAFSFCIPICAGICNLLSL